MTYNHLIYITSENSNNTNFIEHPNQFLKIYLQTDSHDDHTFPSLQISKPPTRTNTPNMIGNWFLLYLSRLQHLKPYTAQLQAFPAPCIRCIHTFNILFSGWDYTRRPSFGWEQPRDGSLLFSAFQRSPYYIIHRGIIARRGIVSFEGVISNETHPPVTLRDGT